VSDVDEAVFDVVESIPPGRVSTYGAIGRLIGIGPRRVARALSQLPNDKPIVLYCKTGVRSAEVLAAVKNAGFKDAVHVQGGVTAWATRIDKGLPNY
jgi:rhodanese-related sulfurtransferase